MRHEGMILSLCDLTGNWSQPYLDAGYEVVRIDLQRGDDVRLLRYIDEPVHGILAAPPCTHFSRAGARWWSIKGDVEVLEGLAVVDACLRAVAIYRPTWWVIESPCSATAPPPLDTLAFTSSAPLVSSSTSPVPVDRTAFASVSPPLACA